MFRRGCLQEYELDWWIPTLLPVLNEIVAAADGAQNSEFWENFFKRKGGSGGPYFSGHITQFFPYLQDRKGKPYQNPWLDGAPKAYAGRGITTGHIPSGLAFAPFLWKYRGQNLPMEFVAGFVGAMQNSATYAIRPEIGWCVRYA